MVTALEQGHARWPESCNYFALALCQFAPSRPEVLYISSLVPNVWNAWGWHDPCYV